MKTPSLLLSALLIPAASAVKDLTGPGIVSCPLEDYMQAPCVPSFVGGSPSSCSDLLSCVLGFAVPDLTTGEVLIPIPCDCTTALDCADSCTLLPSSGEGLLPNQTDTGVDFVGPGIVSCPLSDYLLAPCIPLIDPELNCTSPQSCTQFVEVNNSNVDPNVFSFPIPCDCLKASGCAASCTFEAGPLTGVDFTGPGYITCPFDDYTIKPCSGFEISDNCTLGCSSFDILPTIDATSSNVTIPLPCECLTVTNCPASCVFEEGEPPTLPPIEGSTNFTGPGIVTCSVADFIEQPCEPYIVFEDGRLDCNECSFNLTTLDGYTEGNTTFDLPLLCECLGLKNCPGSCTFADLEGSSLGPASTGLTPSPSPDGLGSTSAPVQLVNSTTASPSSANSTTAPPTTSPPTAAPVTSTSDATTAPTATPVEAPTISAPQPAAATTAVPQPVVVNTTTAAPFLKPSVPTAAPKGRSTPSPTKSSSSPAGSVSLVVGTTMMVLVWSTFAALF